ncbi:hypothetical protein Tco_0742122, partial [Tanacetum coccineum]
AAAKKRSRRHLTETNEYISENGEGILIDPTAVSTAYQNMKSLCPNIRNEIFTDIDIHNRHILPREYWDEMGQNVLRFLEDWKDNRAWYRSSTVAILDETFASHMQQLIGDTLKKNDLEPPSIIAEVRSIIGCYVFQVISTPSSNVFKSGTAPEPSLDVSSLAKLSFTTEEALSRLSPTSSNPFAKPSAYNA